MPLDAVLLVDSGTGQRHLDLSEYLDANAEEAAAEGAYAWIKSLRHVRVGGQALRQRFTYRGDSLWWFAELYLHKERSILTLFQAIHAVEALIERERPLTMALARADPAVQIAVSAAAAARRIPCTAPALTGARRRRLAMDVRSSALALAAMASPHRPAALPSQNPGHVTAFVHTAFWKATGADDGSAESYIGPVLQTLERRLPQGSVQFVGVGPSTNFRARRWWRPQATTARRITPVEQLVPRSALHGSWALWRSRHAVSRELAASEDIRKAAVIRGCDCWPIVREALDGIALLQFPWSARAMDEAAAALDVLKPQVAVTYAEAGGWGRALALEARRRRIPLAGLQHGFIYRHWLNYRHEADEMAPAFDGSADTGFPRPALTLVFDDYAAQHLATAARFPGEAIAVTGSPRLDALVAETKALTAADIDGARRAAGVQRGERLIVIVSKYTEIRSHLPGLLSAIRDLTGARAVIKTHPAETPAPYEAAAHGVPNARVLPASAPLAPLLRAADVVATVNSTVAIDALVLGVPALTVGLPNNLSPFVEAGAMVGTAAADEIGPALRRVLYDQGFRQQLEAAAAAVTARYRIAADGRAAERSAEAVLALAGSPKTVRT
jgi:hypothetical protein